MRARPFALWVLMVVLSFSFAVGWQRLSGLKNERFFYFADAHGLAVVHMLALAVVAALDLVSLWTVVSPRPIGFWLILIDLSLWWVTTTTRSLSRFLAPEAYHEAFREFAETHGLEVSEKAMLQETSGVVVLGEVLVMTVLVLLLVGVVVRNRAYFLEPHPVPDRRRGDS